jgi:hypothetical protein
MGNEHELTSLGVYDGLPALLGSVELAFNTTIGFFDIGEHAVLFLVWRIVGDYSLIRDQLNQLKRGKRVVNGEM